MCGTTATALQSAWWARVRWMSRSVVRMRLVNGPRADAPGNLATFGVQGQAIYDVLKGNPNLFLMLSGHVTPPEGRRPVKTWRPEVAA